MTNYRLYINGQWVDALSGKTYAIHNPATGEVVSHGAYGDEEDYPQDRSRWIVIGCGVLTLLFCCMLVGAVILIDQTNSYCSLPMADQFFYCP